MWDPLINPDLRSLPRLGLDSTIGTTHIVSSTIMLFSNRVETEERMISSKADIRTGRLLQPFFHGFGEKGRGVIFLILLSSKGFFSGIE